MVKHAHQGETVVAEKLTLGEYLTQRWLPVQEPRLRASTYDSYRRNIDLHLIPRLGQRRLDQLTADDIDLFYAALLKNGSKKRTAKSTDGQKVDPKGLSPKTVHNIHVMLNTALSGGARKGTAVRNVVALADAPWLRASPPRSHRAGVPPRALTRRRRRSGQPCQGPPMDATDENSISVLGRDLLLVDVGSGAETHLAEASDGQGRSAQHQGNEVEPPVGR